MQPATRHEPALPSSRPRLWRNRDFLLLWSGQAVSSVGTEVSLLAFPLLILALTHSPAQAGILTALRSLPFVVLSLPAGAYLDRWDRKRTMILSDTIRALALGSIPPVLLTGHLTFLQLAVVALVEGTLFTVFNIAESAALPRVVAPEDVAQAVGLNQTIESTAILLGPSLSGALFAVGRALPFLADAISYAASVISLLFIHVPFQAERTDPSGALGSEIRDGVLWLWRHSLVRFLALLVGGLNLFSFGYPIIMIVRAQQLHGTSAEIGLLFASGGLGSILGSLALGPLQRRFTVGQIMVVGAWVWTLTWIPYALAPNLLAFGVANALGWVIIPIFLGTQYSYRLRVIPDELQGRANSVFKLLAYGAQPISLAFTGFVVQALGPVNAIWIFLLPQIILAAIATANVTLRRAPRLSELAVP